MSKAPMLVASIAAATAASALEADGQRRAIRQQEDANDTWLNYQRKAQQRAQAAEQTERKSAWQQAEEFIAANSQKSREAAIDTGAAELEDRWGDTVGLEDFGGDARGSGQEAGRSGEFDTALAAKLNEASGDVRKRLQSLARASAYGTSGMGGMIGDAGRYAGQNIREINARRSGNANVLAADRAVQPEAIRYEQSPLVPILKVGSAMAGLGAGAGVGGSANLFGAASKAGPGMTFGNTSALSGTSGAGLLPGAANTKSFSFMPVPWNNNVVQF